jgi:hypothetical protein
MLHSNPVVRNIILGICTVAWGPQLVLEVVNGTWIGTGVNVSRIVLARVHVVDWLKLGTPFMIRKTFAVPSGCGGMQIDARLKRTWSKKTPQLQLNVAHQ